ncbi:MAG: 30S ribosomal protein S9 [bacterium]
MADDETRDDKPEQPPAEEAAAKEAPTEEPTAEEPAADGPEESPDGASDEVAEAAVEPAAPSEPDPADTGREAEDVGGESAEDVGGDTPEEPAAEEAPAEEPAAEADAPEPEAGEEPKKAKDAPPGAELEPIAIEPDRPLSAEERARAEAEAEERASRDAAATDDPSPDEPVARAAVKLAADTRIQATGKRKSSIARVIVQPGKGAFEINSHALEEYFPRHQHQTLARQPLVTAGYEGAVDVRVRVHGGGISGQAGAVRHGVARALTEIDPELRGELKRRGLLTRDARKKERRKAGLKKARKRPQFSKR